MKKLIFTLLFIIMALGVLSSCFGNFENDECKHENLNIIPGRKATCEKKGSTEGKTCLDCGLVLSAPQPIKKTDHQYVLRDDQSPFACFEDAEWTYECEVCDDLDVKTVSAGTHMLMERGDVVLPASCTEDGIESCKCKNPLCSYTSDKTVPALGHDLQAVRIEPDDNGMYIIKECQRANCDYTTREFVALGDEESDDTSTDCDTSSDNDHNHDTSVDCDSNSSTNGGWWGSDTSINSGWWGSDTSTSTSTSTNNNWWDSDTSTSTNDDWWGTDSDEAKNEIVTLTLDANGGVLPEGWEKETAFKVGTKVRKLPTPTKEGAEFFGWFNDAGEKVTAPLTIEEDTYLTASWQDGDDNQFETVTITLLLNGGKLPDGYETTFEAEVGSLLGDKFPTPTKLGFKFLGWFEDGDERWKVDDQTEVEDYDMEFHALWEIDTSITIVVVEFFLNYSETLEDGAKPYFEMEAGRRIADFVDKLPTATKDGYKFDGWKDANGNRVSLTTKVNSDMRLTPIWEQIIYCYDGTENHQWNAWQDYSEATCTAPAQRARICNVCGHMEYRIVQEATGHKFGNWATSITANGIIRSRICVECNEKEVDPLNNIAFDSFKTPVVDGDCWGSDRGANLFDGNYTDRPIASKGTGALTVTIEAKEATYVDMIAVTGYGSAAYSVTVYFEDGTSKGLGVGAFGSGDSATKTFNVNKVVTKFVIEMPSPSNGNDIWSEISILVIPD